jgi:hypothetical protein
MLPSWIIEEIKKREQEKLRRDDRPCIELPLEPPPSRQRPSNPPSDEPDHEREEDGCGTVIDLS